MNMSTRMEQIEVLRVEIEVLKREHRDLDEAIHAMQEQGHLDALRLQRLKKQKLALKDKIEALNDRINPDIIA
ncbi:YdcH family protein [Celeribacter sp.]|uniref:YdcH family protein n=1 Tax=Celeribacter sp. TaxID=1890673 RepID=UPI003A8DB1FE